jgi:phage terminase small subunit
MSNPTTPKFARVLAGKSASQKTTAVTLLTTEGKEQIIEDSFGPAMLALTPKQRAFVLARTLSAGDNATQAAAAAGYEGDRDTLNVTASRLSKHPAVQAAIHEEAERRLFGAKLLATGVLLDIMGDVNQRTADRLKAVSMVLNRTGLSEKTEHHVVVEHTRSQEEMIGEIAELAKRLGMDPGRVLGSVGVTIDVEPISGLEDVF